MIELTRLNGQKLFVNCDLLKYAEASPDTVLTLMTGDKIVVREGCADVVGLTVEYHSRVIATAWPTSALAPGSLISTKAMAAALNRNEG